MKKILSIVLVLAMCLGIFAGCNNNEPAGNDALSSAKEYLFTMYKPATKGEPTKLTADKDITAIVTIDGVTYNVEWTVKVTSGPAEGVVIGESSTANHVKIDIMDQPEEELFYTLTATIKDDEGNTETVSFDYYTPAVKKVEVTEDRVVLYHPGDNKYVTDIDYLYTSSSSGNQKHELVLTENEAEAVSLTVQKNDDGSICLITDSGLYLFCDGNNVQFVAEAGDYTKFYLEAAEGGQYIKSNAIAYEKPQYLEVYSGYLTCYGMNAEKANLYTFELKTTNAVPQSAILDAAYALGENEALEGTYTLTGEITKIDTAWSDEYKNITVTIVCDGDAERPMMCYRLKGDGAQDLAVGDKITVTGAIKNYNGTVEFDAGCNLDKVVKAEGGEEDKPSDDTPAVDTPTEKPATLAEQIAEAGKLANKEYLGYESTITGTITDEPVQGKYNEVEFKFTVSDGTNTILCYYTPVTGGTPKKGDTITVTGKLTAYGGTAQFDSTASAVLAGASEDDSNEDSGMTATDVTLENGMQVVIYAPAYGKAFSSTMTGYYQNGVDVTIADGVLSGYGDTEVWTVVVNADGTYSFEQGGQKISMGAEFNSMKLGDVNDAWEVTALGNGLYNIKNAARGTYIDWYASKSNWSTYTPADPTTDDAYQLAFYVVSK